MTFSSQRHINLKFLKLILLCLAFLSYYARTNGTSSIFHTKLRFDGNIQLFERLFATKRRTLRRETPKFLQPEQIPTSRWNSERENEEKCENPIRIDVLAAMSSGCKGSRVCWRSLFLCIQLIGTATGELLKGLYGDTRQDCSRFPDKIHRPRWNYCKF